MQEENIIISVTNLLYNSTPAIVLEIIKAVHFSIILYGSMLPNLKTWSSFYK